jgi:hypothetical protein
MLIVKGQNNLKLFFKLFFHVSWGKIYLFVDGCKCDLNGAWYIFLLMVVKQVNESIYVI